MCGILAVYSKKEKLNRDRCISALKTISWRGPDLSFHDFLEDDRLFMGQTVLSITGDILKGKGSCLKSNSGRYRILYNGEIYNYRELESAFLSSQPELLSKHKTDTEVLSNLHEVLTPSEIFSGLDGMFAYFVYDSKQKKVFIGRDVQGEKSLFVYEDDDILAVSSEIQAILAIIGNVSIDKQALRDYFRTRHFMLFDRTAYAGIRNLMPGRLESFDIGSFGWHQEERLDLGSWINPQIYMDNKERSIDSLADELDEILRTSVGEMIPRKRNYAVVVSGGVDSSLLAYYFIKQHEPKMLVAVNHVGKDIISCNLEGFEK